jgi:cytochrome c peroxidase
LSDRQKAGLRTFISTGCAGCHNGVNFGGTMYQKFGLIRDYWAETGSDKPDAGRYSVTRKDEDRYMFRVAMLRNITKTAPYFHDGSVETLDRAVRVMGSVQLGRQLDDATVAAIVSFLETLTGDVPSNYAPPGRARDER